MVPNSMLPITRKIRETFEIARGKARHSKELEQINSFFDRLAAIGPARDEATRQILANKAARGEQVRALTTSEREFVDDLKGGDGPPLHPLVRQRYEEMEMPGEVLKGIAHSQLFCAALIRRHLSQYHPDDRVANSVVLDMHQSLGDALLDFIGDTHYAEEERRKAARESVPTDGSGGDVYVLLEIENERDTNTAGKNIGRALNKLDRMAEALSVTPIGEFFGFGGRGSGTWFPVSEGLRTVTALIEQLKLPLTKLTGKKAVLAELSDMLGVLTYGGEHKTRFHVEIDV